tara:strand:+ start:755 stop:1333 length:579 start_codon:yes stop_codon:yes gene_type:complete
MKKVFYKEKLIIISSDKNDLSDCFLIESKNKFSSSTLDILKKKNIKSIGIFSKNPEKFLSNFPFPKIVAAGGIVINDKNEILFIFRDNKWDLPKGKAEKNENISQTAIREVEEETGIKDLIIVKPVEITYHIFKRSKKNYLKETYWFEMKSNYYKSFTPQINEGITRVEWIPKEKIPLILKNTYPNIILLIS